MMVPLLIALAILVQPPEMVPIKITSREMNELHSREDIIRGTCDGRPASATITKAYRGARGRVVLRAGRWAREVPPAFLNGSLLSSGLKSAELACDGRRLQLHALAIRADSGGNLVMMIQNAVLDLRTGVVSIDELRTLSPAETRSEFN